MPERVVLLTVAVASLKIAPPSEALSQERVLLAIVRLPELRHCRSRSWSATLIFSLSPCLCGQPVWYNCSITRAIFEEVLAMAITVEAVYENGVLKLAEPLPLEEHEKVSVTVEPARPPIWVRLAARAAETPREEVIRLPPDGAAQIDHYLYGHPRRPE